MELLAEEAVNTEAEVLREVQEILPTEQLEKQEQMIKPMVLKEEQLFKDRL